VLCAHMLPVYILVHKLKSYIFSAGTWTEEGESNGSAQKLNMPPSSVCPYITTCANFLLIYCIPVYYSRKQLAIKQRNVLGVDAMCPALSVLLESSSGKMWRCAYNWGYSQRIKIHWALQRSYSDTAQKASGLKGLTGLFRYSYILLCS
jgi:hypothetical protein